MEWYWRSINLKTWWYMEWWPARWSMKAIEKNTLVNWDEGGPVEKNKNKKQYFLREKKNSERGVGRWGKSRRLVWDLSNLCPQGILINKSEARGRETCDEDTNGGLLNIFITNSYLLIIEHGASVDPPTIGHRESKSPEMFSYFQGNFYIWGLMRMIM